MNLKTLKEALFYKQFKANNTIYTIVDVNKVVDDNVVCVIEYDFIRMPYIIRAEKDVLAKDDLLPDDICFTFNDSGERVISLVPIGQSTITHI